MTSPIIKKVVLKSTAPFLVRIIKQGMAGPAGSGGGTNGEINGGNAASVYLLSQTIDGGNANGV